MRTRNSGRPRAGRSLRFVVAPLLLATMSGGLLVGIRSLDASSVSSVGSPASRPAAQAAGQPAPAGSAPVLPPPVLPPPVLPPPVLSAPVLSVRRAPQALQRSVAAERLRQKLDVVMADPALAEARQASCLTVSEGGVRLYGLRPDQPLVPASNLKLVTAATALARLGPDSRLMTEVKAARPVVAGVVEGPLFLIGGGDPLLATADWVATLRNQPQPSTPLEALADNLVAAGVRQVRGGVLGDESRYDEQRYIPTWRASYLSSSESGPASALTVNDGFAFDGRVPKAAPEPAVHAAATLSALLQARGVTVGGPPGEGTVPPGAATVAALASLPLREVVGEMLRESDNLTAELLVKELGHRFGGGGTTAAGLGVVRQTLADAGVAVDGLTLTDGSGLDRSNRATCALLQGIVEAARPRLPGDPSAPGPAGAASAAVDQRFPDLTGIDAGLPVAARSGTLATRFSGNPAAGRLRAKTGYLERVVGLSGFVERAPGAAPGAGTVAGVAAPPGGPLAFALLANGVPGRAAGFALQERVGAVLATHPDAPPVESFAPRPVP